MRPPSPDYDAFELLPTDTDARYSQRVIPTYLDAATQDLHATPARPRSSKRILVLTILGEAWKVLPFCASLIPLALLLGFAGKLTHSLALNACTPGGDFVVPLNASIWNPSAFFEITISFLGSDPTVCGHAARDPFGSEDCKGYTFTEVKVIDLAWDILVGRGGQALLVIVAYRLSSRKIATLMEEGEVRYEIFATVAFQTGSWSSITTLFWQSVRSTPVPRSRRATWSFVAMLLATIYIVALPSLVSAMTGYAPRFRPYVKFGSAQFADGSLVDCWPGLEPAWGRLGLSDLRLADGQMYGLYTLTDANTTSLLTYKDSDMWIDYYQRYKHIYDQCPEALDISSCMAARTKTTLVTNYGDEVSYIDVLSPMPGIIPYANNKTDSAGKPVYRFWQCGYDTLVDSHSLVQSPDFDLYADPEDQAVGICQADKTYAWGFSFLFSFLVVVLHLLFVVVMYVLWLLSRPGGKTSLRSAAPGIFPDAVTMVTQAQKQYGSRLDEWTAAGLNKEILHGQTGMSFAADEGLRKRKAEQSQTLGDAHGGDWGGDAVLDVNARWKSVHTPATSPKE